MAKIKLVKTTRNCAILESKPRYDVVLDGKVFDQLWFNTHGYVGYLPTPDGCKLQLPEQSISEFRKDVAQLNREWKEHGR